MNKKELVNALAEKMNVTKVAAESHLNGLVEVISEVLETGENVKLVGFGTFEVVKRAKRKGINPQTGKKINIPAKSVPVFRPGKELKDKVNK
ncbi:MAG TPA: HU family DNA-binding protein [Tepiditoga sp.]|nr:HU family DNA-binding protein [Thermotogota bacterium]HOO75076.1 HU family DNA-binding protein [Tepiditoga sp.]